MKRSVEDESMQHMTKEVWINQMLGIVRRPDIPRPGTPAATLTPDDPIQQPQPNKHPGHDRCEQQTVEQGWTWFAGSLKWFGHKREQPVYG